MNLTQSFRHLRTIEYIYLSFDPAATFGKVMSQKLNPDLRVIDLTSEVTG